MKAITWWRKSSASAPNGGQCVELAMFGDVHIRDTKDRQGPSLRVDSGSFQGFLSALKADRL